MNTRNQPDSSNKLAILPMWVIDRIKEEMRLGPAAWQAITDAVEQAEVPQALPCQVKLPPGTVIGQGAAVSTLMLAIQQRARQPAHAQVFSSVEPEQPHPEPIAWMVGTAFWRTKEEAERDAAATGLPIIAVGPITDTASPPVECIHEWTDDGEFMLVCTACGTQENHDPKWRDMASAPRDGTLVRLLVEFTEHATEDSESMPSPTIGANSYDHTGEDVWQFAGWSWEQDCFTQGAGDPIGWLPLLDTPHTDPCEVERLRSAIKQQKSLIASLRAELVESRSIDASAEPSAPVLKRHHDVTMFQRGVAKS